LTSKLPTKIDADVKSFRRDIIKYEKANPPPAAGAQANANPNAGAAAQGAKPAAAQANAAEPATKK